MSVPVENREAALLLSTRLAPVKVLCTTVLPSGNVTVRVPVIPVVSAFFRFPLLSGPPRSANDMLPRLPPERRAVSSRDDMSIFGWAALSPASSRRVYAGVAEVSVYVAASARGMGVGRSLLVALTEEAERNGFWTLQAGIFPENPASIALHKHCGFREVGRRERIGTLRGVWRDVILLERRSRTIGVG
jgi:hypothetical protein